MDGNFHMGIVLDEFLEIREQDVPAQSRADADAQLGDPQRVTPLKGLLRQIEGVESFPHLFKKEVSVLGQRDAAGAAGEQSYLEGILQTADGFADGGLADIKFFGRLGNVSVQSCHVKDMVEGKILVHNNLPYE